MSERIDNSYIFVLFTRVSGVSIFTVFLVFLNLHFRGRKNNLKMPFMRGVEPIRRTIKYLNAGRLVLKDEIHIFSINYSNYGQHHSGIR